MSEQIDHQYTTLRSDLVKHLSGVGRLAVVKAPPGSGKTFTLIEVLSTLVSFVVGAAQSGLSACLASYRMRPVWRDPCILLPAAGTQM